MHLTLKTVNDALAKLGSDVRLAKSAKYFYFDGGESAAWLDKTVNIATINALTLDQWLQEFRRLRDMNGHLLKGRATEKAQPKARELKHPR